MLMWLWELDPEILKDEPRPMSPSFAVLFATRPVEAMCPEGRESCESESSSVRDKDCHISVDELSIQTIARCFVICVSHVRRVPNHYKMFLLIWGLTVNSSHIFQSSSHPFIHSGNVQDNGLKFTAPRCVAEERAVSAGYCRSIWSMIYWLGNV
jgi:hypothetical protein